MQEGDRGDSPILDEEGGVVLFVTTELHPFARSEDAVTEASPSQSVVTHVPSAAELQSAASSRGG